MKCPYNDCGWCYSTSEEAGDIQGVCQKPNKCVVYGRKLKEAWDEYLKGEE